MSNNKIAIVTDIHIGSKKNAELVLNSTLRFFYECFIPYLQKENIDTIVCLGDWYDNRLSTNTKVLNESLKIFEALKDYQIFLTPGNHDSFLNNQIEINSVKPFGKFSNVKLIETPQVHTIKNKDFLLIPWITNYTDFFEQVKDLKYNVAVGHLSIINSKLDKYRINDVGLSEDFFTNKCKFVISGHFHSRSIRNIKGTEIIYQGAVTALTRADSGEDRGFLVLNTDDLSYEWINNETSLKYIKLTYPNKFSEKTIKNNIIDISIDYEHEEYTEKKFERYIEAVEAFSPALPPNIFPITKDSSLLNDTNFKIDDVDIKSIPTLMKNFVDTLDIKNKDQIYSSLMDLYNESKGDII